MLNARRAGRRWMPILLAALFVLSGLMAGCNRREKKEDPSSSDTSAEESYDEQDEPDPEESSSEESSSDEASTEPETIQSSAPIAPAPPSPSVAAPPPAPPPAVATSSAPPPAPSTPQVSSSTPRPVTSSQHSESQTYTSRLSNVTYKTKGSYSQQAHYQDGSIHSDSVSLHNKTFDGDLTINSAAGRGNITLNNVDVKGTLYVNGGGSVSLSDTAVGRMVADNADVRISASKRTDIGSVTIKESADLSESSLAKNYDGFEDITVSGGSRIRTYATLKGLSAGKLTTKTQSWVTLDANTRIAEVYADAPSYFKGSGTIAKLTAADNNVYYQKRPAKVYVANNAKNPSQFDPDNNYWNDRDGGSSSGNSSSSYRDDVYITWVDSVSDVKIEEGTRKRFRIRTNASKITTSTGNRNVADASITADNDEIIVDAVRVGTTRITVRGTRSNYRPEERSFTVEVVRRDTKPPVIDSFATYRNAFQQIYVSCKVTDEDLAIVQAHVKNGGDVPVTYQDGLYVFPAAEGVAYVVTARDRAGNKSEREYTAYLTDKPQFVSQPAVPRADTWEKQKTMSFAVKTALNNQPIALSVRRGNIHTDLQPVKATIVTEGAYVTVSYNVVLPETGVYTVAVSNSSGETLSDVLTVNFIDNVAPTVSGVRLDSNKVWFTVRDTGGSKMNSIKVLFDQNSQFRPVTPAAVNPEGGEYSFEYLANTQVIYTIVVTDKAGNTATEPVKVENNQAITSRPVIQNIQVNQNLARSVGQSAVISFTVTDKLGIKSVTVNGENALTSDNMNYSMVVQANGAYTIRAENIQGLDTTATANVNILDNEKPIVSPRTVSPDGPALVKTIRFTATDKSVPITVKVNGEIVVPMAMDGSYLYEVRGNGAYHFTVSDPYGNKEEFDVVIADILPPDNIISSSTPPESVSSSSTPPESVSSSSTPPESVSSSSTPPESVSSSSTPPESVSSSSTPPESVSSSSTPPESVSSSSTPPESVSSSSTPPESVSSSSTPPEPVAPPPDTEKPIISEANISGGYDRKTVALTVRDNGGTVTVSVDGANVAVAADGAVTFTAEENRNYAVVAIDAAGNREEKPIPVSGIDKAGPQISMIQPPPSGWATEKQFRFNVSDAESGVSVVTIDGAECAADASGAYAYSDKREGQHVVLISARDNAGNTATHSEAISQIDRTQPAAPAVIQMVNGVQQTVPAVAPGLRSSVAYTANGLSFRVTGAVPASGTQSAAKAYYRSPSVLAGQPANVWNAWPLALDGTASALTLPENKTTQGVTYLLDVKAVDSAGNESVAVSYQIAVSGLKVESQSSSSKAQNSSSSKAQGSSSSKAQSSSSSKVESSSPDSSAPPPESESSLPDIASSQPGASSTESQEGAGGTDPLPEDGTA